MDQNLGTKMINYTEQMDLQSYIQMEENFGLKMEDTTEQMDPQ